MMQNLFKLKLYLETATRFYSETYQGDDFDSEYQRARREAWRKIEHLAFDAYYDALDQHCQRLAVDYPEHVAELQHRLDAKLHQLYLDGAYPSEWGIVEPSVGGYLDSVAS
jgi:hypothetical protein